jgi:hemolysin type calcium-binding protein
MRRALLAVLAALLLAAVPLGLRPSVAWATPTCFGEPATHVMHAGEGEFDGTPGVDVVVGSPGPDLIGVAFSAGADLVCGGGGNDQIVLSGSGEKADGGPGNDFISASDGSEARGGSGNDTVIAAGATGRADGGSGDDVVSASDGATGSGGSGNDLVEGTVPAALYGGSGSDTVRSLSPSPGTKIDCGSASDLVQANGATDVRRCEGAFVP